jgi:hypothetical protein
MENRKYILWAVAVVAAAALLGIAIYLSRPYVARLQERLAGIEKDQRDGGGDIKIEANRRENWRYVQM